VTTKQRGSHQNPPDLNPYNLKIVRFHEHLDAQGRVMWNFFPDQCRHCVTPVCVDMANRVAPGSMFKDEKTGAVLVTEKCREMDERGVRTVIKACPYNIPRYDAEKKMLTKCDMCIDRVQADLPPMCVKTCPTGCMAFGEREEMLALAEKRLAEVKKTFPKARIADAPEVNVFYVLAEEPEHYHAYASFG
jgi:formate dehydrogenase iron-sulfur subunit